MDIVKFQQRVIRQVTSPLHVIYAITSHWFLVLLLLVIGTFIMFMQVSIEQPLYSSSATLILDSPQSIVAQNFGNVPGVSSNFIRDQVKTIHSDRVLSSVVQHLKYDQFNPQVEVQDIDKKQWIVKKIYAAISSKVKEILGGITPSIETSSRENRRQIAIRSFRSRSKVAALQYSSHILLTVFGTNRNVLDNEIDVWILSYKSVSRKLSEQKYTNFFNSGIKRWDKKAEDAKSILEKYIDEHPGANEPMLEMAHDQRLKQQEILQNLQQQKQRILNQGIPILIRPSITNSQNPITPSEDEYILFTLEERLKKLYIDKVELLGDFPEHSNPIKNHEQRIKETEKYITNLKNSSTAESPTGETTEKDEIDNLNSFIKIVKNDLGEKMKHESKIKKELKALKILQEVHDYALTKGQNYSKMDDSYFEVSEGRQMIGVTTLNPPMTEEFETNRLRKVKIFIGTFTGFALGILISIILELLCGKIRFKLDVEEELGLKVVGVLPEN